MQFPSVPFFDRRPTETKPKANGQQLQQEHEQSVEKITEHGSMGEHTAERREIAENSVALTVGHQKDRHVEGLVRLTDQIEQAGREALGNSADEDQPAEQKAEQLHRMPKQPVLFHRCQHSVLLVLAAATNDEFLQHRNDLIDIDNQNSRTLKNLVGQRVGTSIECLAETRDRQGIDREKTQHRRIPAIIDQLQRQRDKSRLAEGEIYLAVASVRELSQNHSRGESVEVDSEVIQIERAKMIGHRS